MQEENIVTRLVTELCQGNLLALRKLEYVFERRAYPEVMNEKKLDAHDKIHAKTMKAALDAFAVESKKGNLFATAFLGNMYNFGFGVKADPGKGIPLVQKAAEANCLVGIYLLARLHVYDGIKDYKKFKADKTVGMELLRKGQAQNCANAITLLGLLAEDGTGAERNVVEAKKLYRQAAEQGQFVAIHKVTQVGREHTNLTTRNPFFFYTPKMLDFTFEIVADTNGRGEIMGLNIFVDYTGSVNIPERRYAKSLKLNVENRQTLLKCYGYVFNPLKGQQCVDSLEFFTPYLIAKKVSEVICDADVTFRDQISKAPQPSAQMQVAPANTGYPSVFYPPQTFSSQFIAEIMEIYKQENVMHFAELITTMKLIRDKEGQTLAPPPQQPGQIDLPAAVRMFEIMQQKDSTLMNSLQELLQDFRQRKMLGAAQGANSNNYGHH